MIDDTRILVTIPARAGSKGVKNKNLRYIGDFNLIDHAIAAAFSLDADVDVVVSSDIDGVEQGYMVDDCLYYYERKPELCTDTALAWDVWQDAVKAAPDGINGSEWDIHLYLEPTSPCRTTEDIQKCINAIKAGHDSVCTVSKAPNPQKFIHVGDVNVCMDWDGFWNNKPRQLYTDTWFMKNGICYACTDKRMKEATTMLDPNTHFLLIKRPVVNIDKEEDFLFAEALLNQNVSYPKDDYSKVDN